MYIKQLRKNAKYTQKQLAEMLDVNQESIANWEKSKSKPSLIQLRDLAMIFDTSVNVILGKEKPISHLPKHFHLPDNKIYDDYYYGHLGIIFHQNQTARWFPISQKVANTFIGLDNETPWINFETMNNRFVAVNLKNITYFILNSDDAGPPDVHWKHTYFEKHLSEEMYRGLAEYPFNNEKRETSDKYNATIDEYIKEHNLDEEKVFEMVYYTKIYGKNNMIHEKMWADDRNLALMFYITDLGVEKDEYIYLTDDDQANHYKLPNSEVTMIDSPRYTVLDELDDYYKEIEEE